MKKRIISLILILVIIISSISLFAINFDNSNKTSSKYDEDYSADDIIDEVDENLLGEDDELEIGEMI
jgi:predicted RND superfamily exporter protein